MAEPEPVGCEPTAEEVSQNVEQQKTELETLQSIYSEEINDLKEDTEYLVSFITLYYFFTLSHC